MITDSSGIPTSPPIFHFYYCRTLKLRGATVLCRVPLERLVGRNVYLQVNASCNTNKDSPAMFIVFEYTSQSFLDINSRFFFNLSLISWRRFIGPRARLSG